MRMTKFVSFGAMLLILLFAEAHVMAQVRCKRQQDLDLSGTYSGVYFVDKNDKEGVPAKLKITGNTFEIVSDSLKGTGLISGVNSCGETAISLKFIEAAGEEQETLKALLNSAISLDARTAGDMGQGGRGDITSLHKASAVVMSTARDLSGTFAGADIAFVICPNYPKCKRYTSCPCPAPSQIPTP